MYTHIYFLVIFICISGSVSALESGSPFNSPDPIRVKEREHSILFYQGNYVPSSVTAFEGEELILHFANFSFGPQCLWSKRLDFFVSSYQGKVTSSSIKDLKPGTYEFSCPSEDQVSKTFTLTVLKNFDKEEQNIARNRLPSSLKTNEDLWAPRDESEEFLEKRIEIQDDKIGSKYSDYPDDDYENYFQGVN